MFAAWWSRNQAKLSSTALPSERLQELDEVAIFILRQAEPPESAVVVHHGPKVGEAPSW
jgi:hypothetical protein